MADGDIESNLKIELRNTEESDNCLLVALSGAINTYNADYFQKKISRFIELGYVNLVLGCMNLTSVSDMGIGAFAFLLKLAKNAGGDLVLVDMNREIQQVFKLSGFAQFFKFAENFEDATSVFDKNFFPAVFNCPSCGRKLKAVSAGRFRCPKCKAVLSVGRSGQIIG